MCDLRFENPFCLLVAGSSQSGKTRWVLELLRRREALYSLAPGPVFYFYNEWQSQFEDVPGDVKFLRDMPTMQFLETISGQNATVVIDDLMHSVTETTCELFTVGCARHLANIVFLTQNLFDKNRHFRTISLNCKYIHVRKNPRDSSSILHFAKQFAPGDTKTVTSIYERVTQRPYSYLLFDLSQRTPDPVRIRTNVLCENARPVECFPRSGGSGGGV